MPAWNRASETTPVPSVGSAESMAVVLRRVKEINERDSGASSDDMRRISREAGKDPRGLAGYYNAGLLEVRKPEMQRWITEVGEARLTALEELHRAAE